jgi:aminoglycoside 6'-N-acetyltransferase I
MKSQLYIKSVNSTFFNRPNLGIFVDTVFKNFMDLYNYPQLNHNKNEIFRLLNSETFHGFLIFYGNKIIGYLLGEIVNYNNMNLYFINYLFVAPVFRDKKLGKQLMKNAIEFAKMQNMEGIGLICDSENDKNMNFYNKLGFVLSDNRLYQRHELFILHL